MPLLFDENLSPRLTVLLADLFLEDELVSGGVELDGLGFENEADAGRLE